MRDAVRVVRGNGRLLVFPVLATVGLAGPVAGAIALGRTGWAVAVGEAVVLTVVGAFFSAVMICAADDALQGRPVRIGAAYARAARRWRALLVWGLVGVAVNLAVQMLRRALGEVLGEVVSAVLADALGVLWEVGSYLVLPAMVLDGHGLREAAAVSARAFGPQGGSVVRSRFLFALPAIVVLFPALALGVLAGESQDPTFTVTALCAAVAALAFAATLGATFSGVFRVRLYRAYAGQSA